MWVTMLCAGSALAALVWWLHSGVREYREVDRALERVGRVFGFD